MSAMGLIYTRTAAWLVITETPWVSGLFAVAPPTKEVAPAAAAAAEQQSSKELPELGQLLLSTSLPVPYSAVPSPSYSSPPRLAGRGAQSARITASTTRGLSSSHPWPSPRAPIAIPPVAAPVCSSSRSLFSVLLACPTSWLAGLSSHRCWPVLRTAPVAVGTAQRP
ncbi:hypothetical protein F5884DRAFT_190647 [Xylogone sp. PMI_703]|nr:hypothetical protein F5884DRAFT_190647 [Xylogone sp. PMI_703]